MLNNVVNFITKDIPSGITHIGITNINIGIIVSILVILGGIVRKLLWERRTDHSNSNSNPTNTKNKKKKFNTTSVFCQNTDFNLRAVQAIEENVGDYTPPWW